MDDIEIRKNIHGAFYRVIRIGDIPTLEAFFGKQNGPDQPREGGMTVKETWPQGQPTPADFPDFWWEGVALEIQNGFIARKKYFNELTVAYLKAKHDAGETWESVAVLADRKLDSLIKL